MKGDLTRDTFKPGKHYSSVRMQQGRVQLDADSNEQLDITSHRIETETIDSIGDTGAPINNAGFGITASGNDLVIGAGRYYVNGILCENENDVSITEQPDLPAENDDKLIIISNDLSVSAYPPEAGDFIAYLDVWRRHITALEDPEIRETALLGPDTATRVKTVWQVKLFSVNNENTNCLTEDEVWNELISLPDGKLSARAKIDETKDTPCIIKPGAGYVRLENQLYRVEIHTAGTQGKATFKWSRDNGSIEVDWLAQDSDNLTVSSLGRDKYLGFSSGQWIELFDDSNELYNTPGLLVKIIKAEDNVIQIDDNGQTVDIANFPDNPRIRRWDSEEELTVSSNTWITLEDGVQVKFSDGDYKTGNYWLIAARTATGDVEWETDSSGNPVPELPKGIEHSFCRLAITRFDGESWTILSDCRKFFPPATELINLFYVSGDGQEVMPDSADLAKKLQLPKDLYAGVSNGKYPVDKALIRFTILTGSGNVNGSNTVTVQTAAGGTASCKWSLDSVTPSQQVQAELVDVNGNRIHLPIIYTANLSTASNVSYTPECNYLNGNKTVQTAITALCNRQIFAKDVIYEPGCENLADTKNVQEALDLLCKLLRVDPGIYVKKIKLYKKRNKVKYDLLNDSDVSSKDFSNGIYLVCDRDVDENSVKGKPVCSVTIYLPYPLKTEDINFWSQAGVIGCQPVVLDAVCSLENEKNVIKWELNDSAQKLLSGTFFNTLKQHGIEKILARLTLNGNFVWGSEVSENKEKLYLDGEVFGRSDTDAGRIYTALNLPSGDGIRGGNLEMWFYLVRDSELNIHPLPNPVTPVLDPVTPILNPTGGPGIVPRRMKKKSKTKKEK